MKTKRITFDVSTVKHTEIKILSASRGESIKDFVDIAIAEFIKRLKKEK